MNAPDRITGTLTLTDGQECVIYAVPTGHYDADGNRIYLATVPMLYDADGRAIQAKRVQLDALPSYSTLIVEAAT